MCGIAGLIKLNSDVVIAETLQYLMNQLTHRGPDAAGSFTTQAIGIGMTRLSIIDIKGGNQPIFNEENNIALICNGEIYNYKMLRAGLQSRGHVFRTQSDVEVILHLYEEQGEACFKQLNGMFGVAIADLRTNKLILARDPFGQKPLYISEQSGYIAFASELKAITALPDFSKDLCDQALSAYLCFRYIPAPLTIFRQVTKLRPGSWLSIDIKGQRKQQRYWSINFDPAHQILSNGSKIESYFTKSVERHLMSERPLGVFLSGGVDSACILAALDTLGHKHVHTFTVGFEGYIENEFALAQSTAKHFATHHTEILLSPNDFIDSLPDVIYHLDEPMADLTAVPLFHLSAATRKEAVVVLSGEGADELLAGYIGTENILQQFQRHDLARRFRWLATILKKLPATTKLQNILDTILGSHADYLVRNPQTMGLVFDDKFRSKEIPKLANIDSPLNQLSQYFRERQQWHGIDLYLGGLIETWLPDDLLHKADRMTMAHSLELRAPFLDMEFARYCALLPISEKVRPQAGEINRKIALKREFENRLPSGLTQQKKKGFNIPVYEWLSSGYSAFARSQLSQPEALGNSLVTQSARKSIFDRAKAGDLLSQRQVWSLIVLNLWGDCYL